MRKRIAFEIFETEKTYVDNLKTAIEVSKLCPYTRIIHLTKFHSQVFFEPLKLRSMEEEIIDMNTLNFIFGNLQLVLNVNIELLNQLTERMSDWNSQKTTIGDVFIKFVRIQDMIYFLSFLSLIPHRHHSLRCILNT